MVEERLRRLRQILAEQQLDAIVVTQPENRRYLSGFTGSAGALHRRPTVRPSGRAACRHDPNHRRHRDPRFRGHP